MLNKLKYIVLVCYCMMSLGMWAQDAQRFAERHIIGTARYVGMGGAMTAIGGDPSAVLDNPAGLGLYRHSELSLSVDETLDRTQQGVASNRSNAATICHTNRLTISQISGVWAWGNPDKQRGMIFNNFMLTFNNLANYNRDVYVQGKAMGMLPTLSLLTKGLDETYLQNLPWNDTEIGWLSILGYEGYLINPVGTTDWAPSVNMTDGALKISEVGNANQCVLSWASNISNQYYVGVSLNIPSLNYTKRSTFQETDRIHSAEIKSMYHVSGVGVAASVGMIYRPLQCLRIGASLQTPTVMSLSMQTEGDMRSMVSGQSYEILTPESGVVTMEIMSPLRTSVSVAGQLTDRGLLALQYDYAHAAEMDAVHTLRVGAEARLYHGIFANAGYVYESSFLREDAPIGLAYNSIRTDMDYRYTPQSQYVSFGLGYRSHVLVAQVAYQYRIQNLHQYATEMQNDIIDVCAQSHRIVATLAWKM